MIHIITQRNMVRENTPYGFHIGGLPSSLIHGPVKQRWGFRRSAPSPIVQYK